jgi:hypothetical protein
MTDSIDVSKQASEASPAVENKPATPQQDHQGDRKPSEKPAQQK